MIFASNLDKSYEEKMDFEYDFLYLFVVFVHIQ